jgi:DNA replication protein DnaC
MSTTLTDICRQLRLAYIVETVKERNDSVLTETIEGILTAELEGRKRAKLGKLVGIAGFPHLKTFEGYDFSSITFPPSYNKDKLLKLDWMKQKENVLMMGAVGTGKTHMAIALGVEACRQGMNVQFFRAADLVSILQEKFAEGLITRFRSRLRKLDLLILDEVGYVPFNQTGAELLFNVIADCYEQQSVVVTTNLEFGQWTTVFGDNKLTAALVDRLVHHAHILTFTGDSFRLKEAMQRTQN